MRILFISNVVPWPLAAGDKIRAYHLLRAAAQVGDVALVSFAYSEDEVSDLEALTSLVSESFLVSRETCRYRRQAQLGRARRILARVGSDFHPTRPAALQAWQSPEAEQLVQRLARRGFDIVVAEWLGALPLLRGLDGARRFVNLNDVEHRRLGYRLMRVRPNRLTPFDCLEYIRLRRFERHLTTLPYEFMVCSDVDRRAIGGGRGVWVVPNGVEPSPTLPAPASKGAEPLLVFVGEMSYAPNVDAVTFFARRVLPAIRREVPSARFCVVGRNPVEAVEALNDGDSITIMGSVSSVRPYLEKATLVVVPIRFGGGTRLKILEAMGHGRAVVSTTVGAEGLELRHGEHLLIADQPILFAQSCLRVLRDEGLRERLRTAAYRFVTARYDWGAIERRVQTILVGEARTPGWRPEGAEHEDIPDRPGSLARSRGWAGRFNDRWVRERAGLGNDKTIKTIGRHS